MYAFKTSFNAFFTQFQEILTLVIQVQIQVLNVHLSLPKVNATNLRLLSNLIPLIKSPLISFPSMKLNPQLTFHFDLSMDFHSNYLQVDFKQLLLLVKLRHLKLHLLFQVHGLRFKLNHWVFPQFK